MKTTYKPKGYNSISPYFVVADAEKFSDFLVRVFDAERLRRYDKPDDTILHAEVRIDDSVVMLGNASDEFPPNQLLNRIYVPDVDSTFQRAIDAGCESLEKPKEQEGDPDRRGTFRDYAGNVWSIGTQVD